MNITEQQNNFCVNLNYNGSKSYISVNIVEIYKFKSSSSEINATPLFHYV